MRNISKRTGNVRRIRGGRHITTKRLLMTALILLIWLIYELVEPSGDAVRGTVTRVIDGDTVVVFVAGENRRVRMIGVDTPETVHPRKPVEAYGKEASDFTKRNLQDRTVWLEYDVAPLDRYNRHLAYIWLTKPGRKEEEIRRDMFNARLLLEGYGKVMTIQPNSKYADIFAQFQREAREGKRGLWQ